MSECSGECDCGWPGPAYGPHDPDCRLDKCDGEKGRWCEKHWQESLYEWGWLKGTPSPEQIRQDMIDAGRGKLAT